MFSTLHEALEHNRQTQNPTLDLGKLGLNGTEPKLEQLKAFTWIETLIFSNEWREFDVEKKKWIEQKSQNEGAENNLTYLPALPPQTKRFICAGWYDNKFEISDISPLKDLQNIQSLDLRYNQISDISPLKDLQNIQSLDLSYNQISDISPLKDLQNIQTLDLSSNQISDISPLKDLQNIQTLYLSFNPISDISPLKDLQNIQTLYLSFNPISDISPLKDLQNIQSLDLSDNQISDISPLKDLQNIQSLDLSANPISDISPLKDLQNIQTLDLSANPISDISPLKDLQNIQTLYLSFNPISDISPLKDLQNIRSLDLSNNPFLAKLPENIRAKSALEILRYWIDNQKSKHLREGKVVFVGDGGVGKTSLMHLLLYGRQDDTTRTEKIEIHTNNTLFTYGADKEALTLRFWDFGGQEIMHATHKFFMSSRTLYVLIVEGRKNESEAIQNWIEMLRSSIKDSPVLLVVNQLDNEGDKHNLPDAEYKRAFDNLCLPVIETSWKTKRGIDKLRQAIQDTLQTMPHFKEPFPILYQSIKDHLESIAEPYIDFKTYQRICRAVAQNQQENIATQSEELLADVLNDLGIMLNFRQKHEQLESLFIFKPEWIVDGVYKIVNAPEAQAQKGKIAENSIFALLKGIGYTEAQERRFIIDMMKEFELAYQKTIDNQCYYLVPSLFDKNQPEAFLAWQASSPLWVRFTYKVWRNDYISYFLNNQHEYTVMGTHWVNGAILRYGEQEVKIQSVSTQKHIDIQIVGAKDLRYALWRVREALGQVHSKFDEEILGIEMWVVVAEAGKEDKFSYTRLQKMQNKGKTHEYSEVFDKDFNIAELLDGVSLNKTEIPQVIAAALACLTRANYAGYFEEMNKLDLPDDQKEPYSRLKKEFMHSGDDKFTYSQRLKTFAQNLLRAI